MNIFADIQIRTSPDKTINLASPSQLRHECIPKENL